MRKKDAVSNVFFKAPVRVADLLNGYIYHGQQVVRSEDVHNRGERVYRIDGKGGKVEAQEVMLDVVSEVLQRMQVTIVCLQNQSEIHYAMPVRVMNEEATRYHEAWKEIADRHKTAKDVRGVEYISGFTKDDKLIPVITIVVYWGKKPWDGPKCLKDMLKVEECPLELQKFIVDYPLHLLEVRSYDHTEEFRSDIRHVFGFLQRDGDKDALSDYVEKNRKVFSALGESTYNLLSVMSRCSRLKVVKKNVEKEGSYNMCEAIEGIYQDGCERGRREGKSEGRQLGRRQGRREGRREGRRLGRCEECKHMLLLILGKMGEVSAELEKKIWREDDLMTLEAWSKQALDAKDMEEFLQSMGSM